MSLITKPFTFSAGQVIIASEHNSNFDTIYSDYNGNITNVNIASGAAISDTKLAQITTASKVAISALVTSGDYSGSGSFSLANLTLTGAVKLTETSAPTIAASQGGVYTKDTSGQPELFFREESDGDEVQLTTAGSVRATTSDSVVLPTLKIRAVSFVGNGAAGGAACTINKTIGGSHTVAHTGTGIYTITWATAFADANYMISGMTQHDTASENDVWSISIASTGSNPATGTLRLNTSNDGSTLGDVALITIFAIGT